MEYIEQYEQAVEPARRRFADDPVVRLIQSPEIGAAHLESFLAHWFALGVPMTEPVEGWIRRAGEACVAVGGPGVGELGVALQKHAKAEADHHLMLIADLHRLCERRATAGHPKPDAEELLKLEWPAATHRYRGQHEEVIAGPEPYAQIAIENEMEMLSLSFGPLLTDNCRAVLGEDIAQAMTFLDEHITLDVGHTKFNRRQMAKFLDTCPEALDALVSAGSETLDTYRAFLAHCVGISEPAHATTS